MAAKVPRGKKYCDDVIGNDESSDSLDLFRCYDDHGVGKRIFIEDQCLAEATPIMP